MKKGIFKGSFSSRKMLGGMIAFFSFVSLFYGFSGKSATLPGGKNLTLMASGDSIEIYKEITDSAKDEFYIEEAALWLLDKRTGEQRKILRTVRPEEHFWVLDHGTQFEEASYDSIPAAHTVAIYNENPVQIIVEGCPDFRNIYSYFVDVDAHKAWWIPSNSGYLGQTWEEMYMVFRSYDYIPVYGGRYTLIQVFTPEGKMVKSLSLCPEVTETLEEVYGFDPDDPDEE